MAAVVGEPTSEVTQHDGISVCDSPRSRKLSETSLRPFPASRRNLEMAVNRPRRLIATDRLVDVSTH